MTSNEIISWLLEGDVSIQYQTWRDLLDTEKPGLRKRIESEGWGKRFLSYRQPNGHWGPGVLSTTGNNSILDSKVLDLLKHVY